MKKISADCTQTEQYPVMYQSEHLPEDTSYCNKDKPNHLVKLALQLK